MEDVPEALLEEIFSDVPSVTLPRDKLADMDYIDLLLEANAVKSKGEARRLITNGGAYLNNQRITDTQFKMADSPAAQSELFVVRTGKKSYYLVRVS